MPGARRPSLCVTAHHDRPVDRKVKRKLATNGMPISLQQRRNNFSGCLAPVAFMCNAAVWQQNSMVDLENHMSKSAMDKDPNSLTQCLFSPLGLRQLHHQALCRLKEGEK